MAANPTMSAEDKIAQQPLSRTTAVAYALDPWSAAMAPVDTGAVADAPAITQADDGEEHGWRDAWFSTEADKSKSDPKPKQPRIALQTAPFRRY